MSEAVTEPEEVIDAVGVNEAEVDAEMVTEGEGVIV